VGLNLGIQHAFLPVSHDLFNLAYHIEEVSQDVGVEGSLMVGTLRFYLEKDTCYNDLLFKIK